MVTAKRPARQKQVPIAAFFHFDIKLKKVSGGLKPFLQQGRLIMKPAAADVAIHFLQADDIWRFGFNDLQNPLQAIATISTADPLVDVVTQQTHRKLHSMGGLTFKKARY